MPINVDELEKIEEPKWKRVLAKMEEGKFYSIPEMSHMLVGIRLFEEDSFKQYLPEKVQDKKKLSFEEVIEPLVEFLSDTAYIDSFLQSQVAVGNLIEGFKGDLPYYGKKM
jgi:hypothetical protein